MTVKQRHLDLLRPYLVGETPHEATDGETGLPKMEWDMFCPLHLDNTRSASLNVTDGVWHCKASCGGGRVASLIRQRSEWCDPPSLNGSNGNGNGNGGGHSKPEDIPSEGAIQGWASALNSAPARLHHLNERGLSNDTINRFDIGWAGSVYTIPIRDKDGKCINVRKYNPSPEEGKRKIWGLRGHNAPQLYPLESLSSDGPIIICEGEWDALATIQHGFNAITRTGAADVWNVAWGSLFEGRDVFLCHDADSKGSNGNRRVGKMLQQFAKSIRVIRLPYEFQEKHGKDLSDFWGEGHRAKDLHALMKSASLFVDGPEPMNLDASDVSVLDTFDSRNAGKPVRVTLTVKGKREPGYTVPSKIKYSCTRDKGKICQICPMFAHVTGEMTKAIEPNDPITLDLIDSSTKQIHEALRSAEGIAKCDRLDIDVMAVRAVEELYARPSVDHSGGHSPGDYKTIKITSVGRHDTLPNNTFEIVGALHPSPRNQKNEFLAWEVNSVETSIDKFDLESSDIRKLKIFQPEVGQRPLKKFGEISREIAAHVTKIYGRPEMHAAMDLVFHSALSFYFDDQYIHRGWLELLIVGDTRTGKSEAARRLTEHYGFGEMVSCESASIAGILGGLQQYGSSGEWAINWGVIPINDRRLVVLDEAGGLSPEEIAQLSSVRSSGEAQLTKIQSERTHARTRSIWLANPRDGRRMAEYAYGVQAIPLLIGNPEDIARFDMAMSVATGEVPMEEINRPHATGELKYTTELCNKLVRWVASRTRDQIDFTPGAIEAVYKMANDMGSRYVETPPLIQAANVRTKIARGAVALAARTFSTDSMGENIIVTKDHVVDFCVFLDRIYNMRGFGYAERSREAIKDRMEAQSQRKRITKYLASPVNEGLSKFLRNAGKFRRQDLEEVLNMSREQANATINELWKSRMVWKDRGDVRIEPTLNEILREINE